VTLREALGGDAQGIHELVDQLLDSEDSLIVLIDGRRAVSYAEGFGLSPCQLELITIEVERSVRAVAGSTPLKTSGRRANEEVDDAYDGARDREHLRTVGRRHHGSVFLRGAACVQSADGASGDRSSSAGPVLRLAGEAAASG
jgi:hypothetical protein